MSSRLWQLSNTSCPMEVIESGKVILVNELQSWNACCPIDVIPEWTLLTATSPKHLIKHASGISVIPSGSVQETKLWFSLSLPITVISGPNVIAVIFSFEAILPTSVIPEDISTETIASVKENSPPTTLPLVWK